MAKTTDKLYDGRLSWWIARRDKGRGANFPIYFQHAGRPAEVHLVAGQMLGCPAGYGYKIYHVQQPPANLVSAYMRAGIEVFMQRLTF